MEKYESRVVILSALKLEQDAVLVKLSNIRTVTHSESGTVYYEGDFIIKGKKIPIICGLTGQTNVNAGIETERVIKFFSPEYLFFVGVAGGVKDVKVGDVVIGSDVIGYERGKQEDEFLFRPQFGFSSYALEQRAVSFSGSNEWEAASRIIFKSEFGTSIKVLAGTVASGEKVVANSKSELYKSIRKHASHAIAC